MAEEDTDPVRVLVGELKPCPFCGGEAALGHFRYSRPLKDAWWDEYNAPITEAFRVNCIRCGANNGNSISGGDRTATIAAERWNTRPDEAERVKAENVRLRDAAWSEAIEAAADLCERHAKALPADGPVDERGWPSSPEGAARHQSLALAGAIRKLVRTTLSEGESNAG